MTLTKKYFIQSKLKEMLKGYRLDFFSFFDGYSMLNRVDIISTYPEQWVNFYMDKKLFLIDPVIKYSFDNVKPFFWEEAGLTPEKEIFKLSSCFSITSGASFILHLNGNRLNVLSFANLGKDNDFPDKIKSNLSILQMNLIDLCSDIEKFSRKKPCNGHKILSHRELEVLQWVSIGKTQEETGILLNISTRTVKFHIKNVFLKLDVNNVCYAIKKATMLNIL
ncbi:LuxR family transcriptional regulator [Shigella flexneri]